MLMVMFKVTVFVLGNPNMVTALAGNKADLEEKRKVATEASVINMFLYIYCEFNYFFPRSIYCFLIFIDSPWTQLQY